MVGIYKITNPTGRVYVGQSINIVLRKKSYERLYCREQLKLYNSLVKYGFSSHIFEVIEECTVEELNSRERYWQEFYNVIEDGLNCRLTATEDKSGYLSEEHKQAISKKLTGTLRTFSAEHRENLRKAIIERGYIPPSRKGLPGTMKGKRHSVESIYKMKKPKKKVECPHCKQVGGNSQMTRWHFENCKKRVG